MVALPLRLGIAINNAVNGSQRKFWLTVITLSRKAMQIKNSTLPPVAAVRDSSAVVASTFAADGTAPAADGDAPVAAVLADGDILAAAGTSCVERLVQQIAAEEWIAVPLRGRVASVARTCAVGDSLELIDRTRFVDQILGATQLLVLCKM